MYCPPPLLAIGRKGFVENYKYFVIGKYFRNVWSNGFVE